MRGAYIAQIDRLIFVNNFLISVKGRSARLSRRRRRIFGPRAETRARPRTDRRQIDNHAGFGSETVSLETAPAPESGECGFNQVHGECRQMQIAAANRRG